MATTDWELRFFPASIPRAVGPHFARAMRLDVAVISSGQAKVAAAAAAGSPVVLTAAEADAVLAVVAMRATALRNDGAIPVFEVAAKAGKISPFDGSGCAGFDWCGPILGRSDPQSKAAILACGAAIRGALKGATLTSSAPSLPPVVSPPTGLPGGFPDISKIPGLPGLAGESLGVAPVVIAAGVAGAVLLVGGAGYLIGRFSEESKGQSVKWDAEKVIAIRRAEIAADLALARWQLEADTGKKYDPSPLELGAADDVKELAKQETGSRWGGFALGAGLGVVGMLGAAYAARKVGIGL